MNEENSAPTNSARKRPRVSSSSSSNGSSTDSSNNEDGSPEAKRQQRSPPRSTSREGDLDRRFDLLSQQLVSHVNNILRSNYAVMNTIPVETQTAQVTALPVSSTQTTSKSEQENFLRPPQIAPNLQNIADLDVSIKEPTVPIANPDRVTKITEMQRFNSPDWNAVRYTDVQKKYVAYPSFMELKVNEELRRFEDPFAPLRWFQMERSFAALSNAFLAQNESVNTALQKLIDWSSSSDVQLSPTSLYDKLKELFGSESGYKTVSHDILQIICGKRAEVLELRRRSILKCLKNKYIRDDVEKIPPSNEYMFNPQGLSTYIQKIGGIDKLEKQNTTSRVIRPKSPEPSTSFQDKSFRHRPNKPKQNERKYSNVRRTEEFSAKKKGGRKYKSGRKSGNRNK